MSDRKIRWGVLSTADIGLGAVIPAIQSSDLGEVVAISSRDADRAGRAAADLGIPTAHGSYEALLDDPAVDAVYNPLPNHLHAEWTMKAADAGKHVLCEKPLAMSSEQAQLMVDHCAAAGVKLQEAFMYRFHPQWRRVKEIVDSGELGELRAIQAWFSFFNDDGSDIRNVPEWGGGGLMDIGCYPISISRWLFGAEPDDVAAASFHHPDFGVDVVTSALMRFGDAHATFTCSTLTEWGQRLFVEGAEGRIEIPIPFNPRPDRAYRDTDTRGWRTAERCRHHHHRVPARRPLCAPVRCIRGRHPRRHTGSDAARRRRRQHARHRARRRSRRLTRRRDSRGSDLGYPGLDRGHDLVGNRAHAVDVGRMGRGGCEHVVLGLAGDHPVASIDDRSARKLLH